MLTFTKPRISLENETLNILLFLISENDKNSVILGFGVGNLSLLQNTTVRVGLEQMEVAPEHILLYLTGDGKLAIYCLAR